LGSGRGVAAHHAPGQEHGRDDDGQPAEDHDEQGQLAGPVKRGERLGLVLLVDQGPLAVLQGGGHVHGLVSRGRVGVGEDRNRVPGLVLSGRGAFPDGVAQEGRVHLEAFFGRGLEFALGIDDEGLAGGALADVFHQPVEDGEVDGGAQEIGLAAEIVPHGHHEVGQAAKPQKDVADGHVPGLGRGEPGRFGVVGPAQAEGTGVGKQGAGVADQAEVHEYPAVFGLQAGQHPGQARFVGEVAKGRQFGEHPQLGRGFAQKGVDVLFVLEDQFFQMGQHLGPVGGVELVAEHGRAQQQRRQGDRHHPGHHGTGQGLIIMAVAQGRASGIWSRWGYGGATCQKSIRLWKGFFKELPARHGMGRPPKGGDHGRRCHRSQAAVAGTQGP